MWVITWIIQFSSYRDLLAIFLMQFDKSENMLPANDKREFYSKTLGKLGDADWCNDCSENPERVRH